MLRITQTTNERLELAYRPRVLPAFGLVFLLVGLGSLISWISQGAALSAPLERGPSSLHDGGTGSPEALFGMAVAVVLGGALFVSTARRDHYRFDRGTGALTWRRRNLFGVREGSLALSDIDDVVALAGPACGDTTYRVVVCSRRDGDLPLTPDYHAGEAWHEEIARTLRSFLALEREPAAA